MADGPVIGPINVIPSTIVVEQLCLIPFNFIWVDMEHGPQTAHDLGASIVRCLGRGITPIVRVPGIEDWAVKSVLDQGVRGIVFPFVNSVEDARFAISSCRYPPAGHRGYCPDVAAARWGTDGADYFARANDEICVILQIEHKDAVECVEDIAALPGWDVLFIGPMDLSGSLGKLGQLDDPEVSAAITRVRKAATSSGGRAGILAAKPEDMRRRVDEGFDFIVTQPDIRVVGDAFQSYWRDIHESMANG